MILQILQGFGQTTAGRCHTAIIDPGTATRFGAFFALASDSAVDK